MQQHSASKGNFFGGYHISFWGLSFSLSLFCTFLALLTDDVCDNDDDDGDDNDDDDLIASGTHTAS